MDKRGKKKPNWKAIKLLISPVLLCLVGLLCFKSSLPFRVDEIRPVRDFSFQAAQTVPQEELEKLRAIFSHPFTYVRESDQCYLFISQNKEYLLKFFKMRKLTPKYWLNYIPFPWLEQERLNKIGHRERARQELFGNFKIAFEDFRHQTTLVFIHFFSTNWLKSKVCLIDQEGLDHTVLLDTVPFVLQRRPTLLCEYVDDLVRQDKTKEAVSSLLLILDIVQDRCERGFRDQDGDLESDYGFIGNRAVFTEVAKMVYDESLKTRLATLREVFKISRKISDWLEKYYPSLIEDFQKEAQDLISQLEEA